MDIRLKTEFKLDDEIMLRAWEETDIERGYELVMRNRDHLQPFMHWMSPDYSLELTRKFMTEGIARRKAGDELGFGIFRGDDLLGSIGMFGFDSKARRAEIGYWISKDEEGKGIITRAVKLLIDYAFDELDMNRIEIRCSAENIRSAAIPERLGFKKEGYLRQAEFRNGHLHDFLIFGLLREDRQL
jgi:ribosomal-protein-serine acetyltransferase